MTSSHPSEDRRFVPPAIRPGTSKATLRQSLLAARQSLPAAERDARNQHLRDRLQARPELQAARTILAYWSVRGEPDPTPLVASDWGKSKSWGFPRCVGRDLIWHAWQWGDPLQSGAFGIPEPQPSAPLLNPCEADVVLVPAVACDRRGYRLGYGGGFYDREMARWQNHGPPGGAGDRPLAVGIVFDFTCVPLLPKDPWDRRLSAVCTDRAWYDCRAERP